MTDTTTTDTTTTAEIMPMISLSVGKVFGFTIYVDRSHLAGGGLGKGKKSGTIVKDTLPELLRDVARLLDENGGSLEDLADLLTKSGKQ